MATRLTRFLLRVAPALLAVAVPSTAFAQSTFDRLIARARSDMMVDPARAVRDAEQALAASDPADRHGQATARWLMGEAYGRLGKSAMALPLLRDARVAVEGNRSAIRLLADILLSEGAALVDTGQVTRALRTLQRAHDLFARLGESRSEAKALVLIACLYESGSDHDAALRYFAQAQAQAQDVARGDPSLLLSIYNERGTTLTALGRHADAGAEFARALPLASAMKSNPLIAQVLGNMAYTQLKLGRLEAANRSIARGLAVTARADAAAYRPQLLAAAAAAAWQGGERGRARALIAARFRGVDPEHTIVPDRDAHEIAYRIYAGMNEPAPALRHLAALKRLDDRATAIARSTGAALAAARFDYANQELRIARLKAENLGHEVAFEREAARAQRFVLLGAVAATLAIIVLLAVGIALLRRSRNGVRAANDGLAATNVELGRALRARSEFLATTSHEIRTPLNGILGMTQVMIADRALDPALRERLGVVHGAGVTMRALVDDILDVAKIQSGRLTIEAAPLDLTATVEEATRMFAEQARAKGLSFTVALDNPTRWVTGDAARLRQIVFNLLSNAVKFTAAGGVSLTLGEIDGEGGRRLRLTVADSGIGIAAAAQEAIFEPFRQADAGTTRHYGGTGLGLSICRDLARAMGGDVRVASRPGAGASFTLDLPLVPAAAPDAVPDRPALLVLEANPIQRAMLRALFEHAGPVAFAGDAAEAARTAAAARPARVLAEAGCVTPDSLAALVAAAAPAPVLLLAPACDAAQRRAWLSGGAARVIERPVGRKALVSAVLSVASPLVSAAA